MCDILYSLNFFPLKNGDGAKVIIKRLHFDFGSLSIITTYLYIV